MIKHKILIIDILKLLLLDYGYALLIIWYLAVLGIIHYSKKSAYFDGRTDFLVRIFELLRFLNRTQLLNHPAKFEIDFTFNKS